MTFSKLALRFKVDGPERQISYSHMSETKSASKASNVGFKYVMTNNTSMV